MSMTREYSYERVHVTMEDQVATVFMNWPDGIRDPKRVALFHEEFTDAMFKLRNDDSVRVVILRGAGDRYFLSTFAGVEDSDPSTRTKSGDTAYHSTVQAPQMLEHILKMSKPVIAMVNGDAIGIGATIAMACDIIIAAEDAFITDCHIASFHWMKKADSHQGTVPGDGGAVFWPLLMSTPIAKEMLFTGRPVTARELADMRAINSAVPKEQLESVVTDMVNRLLDRPAWALGWTKTIMNKRVVDNFEMTMDLGLAYEVMAQQRRQVGETKGIETL